MGIEDIPYGFVHFAKYVQIATLANILVMCTQLWLSDEIQSIYPSLYG